MFIGQVGVFNVLCARFMPYSGILAASLCCHQLLLSGRRRRHDGWLEETTARQKQRSSSLSPAAGRRGPQPCLKVFWFCHWLFYILFHSPCISSSSLECALVHHKAGIEGGLQYLGTEREGERLGQFAWIVWVWVFWDLELSKTAWCPFRDRMLGWSVELKFQSDVGRHKREKALWLGLRS